MCVLLVGYRLRADLPLVIAANRDESRDRPSAGPRRLALGGHTVFAPQDLRAGGTWLGIAETGLVVVITNRPDGDFDPKRPSRGQLCQRMLGQVNTTALALELERTLRSAHYNSFNLLFADPESAFVSSWNGRLVTQELQPGTHALSNKHGLGELEVPELHELPWRGSSWSELRPHLIALLGSRKERDGSGYRIFKEGEGYGTVSSSLIRHEAGRDLILEYGSLPQAPRYAEFRLPVLVNRRPA